jgi:hypothetical protein
MPDGVLLILTGFKSAAQLLNQKIVFTLPHLLLAIIIFALGMAVDTGLWLMPVEYERTARAAGNAQIV